MPVQTVDQLEAALRSGKIGSLYLFDGPENWLKEQRIEQILNKLLPPEARDFNYEKFDGTQSAAGDVVASSQSLPFLSKRRLVVVRNADEFSASDAAILADSISGLPASTCLIFIQFGKANMRDVIPAAVNSHGAIVTFWTPFPNRLPEWVVQEVRRRGKTIDRDAAQALAESCSDLQEISNELDKLLLFIGKKTHVSWEDVAAHGLPDLAGDQRQFEEALMTRNLAEALRHAKLMGGMGVRPEILIGVTERVFRTLILAHFHKGNGWRQEEIETSFRIRSLTQKNNLKQGLRLYSQSEAETAIEKIVQADVQMKTGVLPGDVALSLLFLSLMRNESVSC